MSQCYATSMQRTELFAAIAVGVLIVGGAGSLTFATLAGAVVAPGTVMVETHTRKIQNFDGGTVAAIRVKDGDRVAAGDVLLRLDPTEAEASLEIAKAELAEAQARKRRLACESVGCPNMIEFATTGSVPTDTRASDAWNGQAALLEAHRNIRINKKKQLTERIEQLEQARAALLAQARSNDRQVELTARERAAVEPLYASHNVPLSRMLTVEREEERVKGESFRLQAELQRVAGQIAETRLQIAEVDMTALSDVLREVREVGVKETELIEKITALKVRRDRTVIVAPSAGIVHNLTATTTGGVVKAGEIIAEIVPQDEALIIEARIEAASIDRLQINQTAFVRFISFDQRTTPVLAGKVYLVAPDANQDQRTGQTYYTVQTKLEPGEIAKLGDQNLKPGMPCEVQFQTGKRTILSYLVKPFTDQVARGLRER
jgi:HlyD family secretion protein